VAACEASGMTMAEFARREGINYSTLAGWMYRKGQNERGVNAGAIEFAQVHLPGELHFRYGLPVSLNQLLPTFPRGNAVTGCCRLNDVIGRMRLALMVVGFHGRTHG
jgi:hypothetical protein